MESYLSKFARRASGINDIRQINPQFLNWSSVVDQSLANSSENFDISDIKNPTLLSSVGNKKLHTSELQAEIPINQDKIKSESKKNRNTSRISNDASKIIAYPKNNVSLNVTKSLDNSLPKTKSPPSKNKSFSTTSIKNKKKFELRNEIDRTVNKINSESHMNIHSDSIEEKRHNQDLIFEPINYKLKVKDSEPLEESSTRTFLKRIETNKINPNKEITHRRLQNRLELLPPKSPPIVRSSKSRMEQKLVIGKLTVEVLQSPKEKDKQIQLPKKEHTAPSKLREDRSKTHSGLKVQFGLGQI